MHVIGVSECGEYADTNPNIEIENISPVWVWPTQTVACRQLTSFIQYVDQHSDRFDSATAVTLFDRAEAMMAAVPCT